MLSGRLAHHPLYGADIPERARCRRCGRFYRACPHLGTGDRENVIDEEHAARIRARHAFGRLHNPDHDTADYTDEGQSGRGTTATTPGAPPVHSQPGGA